MQQHAIIIKHISFDWYDNTIKEKTAKMKSISKNKNAIDNSIPSYTVIDFCFLNFLIMKSIINSNK